MGENSAVLIQLNTEQTARKFFNYGSRDFDAIFFAHSPLVIGVRARVERNPRTPIIPQMGYATAVVLPLRRSFYLPKSENGGVL
jgi:hypothetical protein